MATRTFSSARYYPLCYESHRIANQTPRIQSVDKYGRPTNTTNFSFLQIGNGKATDELHRYWDWLFASFYNKSPEFDDTNLATTLSDCMGLVDVAESIDAIDSVRPFVDLALLRFTSVLWESVAGNPAAWVELGRRVHSPIIFREGVIHLVGMWSNMLDDVKADLHPDIREICERKFTEIDIAKEAIEMRILGHYPAFLCRRAVDRPGRPSYSSDIYMWMAISFFRQWFAQAMSDGRNRLSPDGGYQLYHQIGAAGQAYLNHEAFKDFHQYFPMSSKACNVLEVNMGVMKEEVKGFVKDILANRTNVDPSAYPLRWLTCALVEKEDYPWHVEDVEANAGDPTPSEPELTMPLPYQRDTKKRRRDAVEQARGNDLLASTLVNDTEYRGDDEED